MGTPTLLENTNPFLQALSAFKVSSPRERAFGRFRLSVPFHNGMGLLERLRPLSGVLAFSHPLREQHASRSWDWHLTCSCRANGIHQAHHADGFQRMPEGASTGLTLIRGNQLAIFASTLLIGLLFKPLHDRMKALIDRRFYRRKYDAARTLATFSATVRDEVDLNQLCTKLEAVVEETMQPTHVSLWLCPPIRYSEETTRALPFINTVGKP